MASRPRLDDYTRMYHIVLEFAVVKNSDGEDCFNPDFVRYSEDKILRDVQMDQKLILEQQDSIFSPPCGCGYGCGCWRLRLRLWRWWLRLWRLTHRLLALVGGRP